MTSLARLSFWIAPERLDDFAAAYTARLAPVLAQLGLSESPVPPRPGVPGVYSRLFSLDAPALAAAWQRWLRVAPVWKQALQGLVRRWRFEPYSAPAGPGRMVPAGSGHRQGVWHTIGVQDGLPCSLITALFQDRRGDLWLGTYEKGVCRYDGHRFQVLTAADGLLHDWVYAIWEDRQGQLWFGSHAGLSRYDGAQFEHFTPADGLAEECVSEILEDQQGNLWLLHRDLGVSCFEDRRCRAFTAEDGLTCDEVSGLCQDQQGRIWFGTQAGLSRYDGAQFERFTVADGLAGNRITALAQDRGGRIWAGTEGGVSRYHGDGFEILAHQPAGLQLYPVLEDQQEQMWFLTDDQGVVRYDGAQFEHFTMADGLGHDGVRAVMEDRDGYLWLGTWGGGLSRYEGNQLRNFTTADGLGRNRVEAVLADRSGRIWLGTWGGGVSRFDGRAFKTFTAADGLAGDHLWSLCEDRCGRIWLGTWEGGVSCFDGEGFRNFAPADGLAHPSVWCILQDRQGQMWFGTQGGGASCFDGERFRNLTVEDGLPDGRVWDIAEDREGNLWFSTFESGVSRYDGERFTTFTADEGLGHDNVWCIFQDREGALWFGTWGGGVSRFDGERFTRFTSEDGLADDNVRSIFQDRQGQLWFCTYGGGVSRYDGQVFQTLSRKDGLAHDAVQDVLEDREGQFWIATEGGVSCYRPPRKAPSIHLKEVIADRRHGVPSQVEILSSQEFVIFEFQGSSFTTRPGQFAYVYRLQGLHEEWRTTYGRRVEYKNLAVGQYTFQVRAVDRDLNYSQPAGLQLAVQSDPQQDRIQALEAELSQAQGLEQFIGQSPALQAALEQIHTVAHSEVTALILGETGTGKGLAARAIHGLSRRREQPFIHVNCGAIPEGLVASELFGHEKGAFTGAVGRKLGRFELADKGTLFLDEVGDLPLESQRVLLQVLQDGTFQRVGSGEEIRVDVRVVAATNRDLRAALQRGVFREDLFYRLSGFVVSLPPLRQCREDVPLLVHHFAEQFARHLQRPVPQIDAAVLDYLQGYAWPGNVRELEHLVQRAILVCREKHIRLEDLPVLEGKAPLAGPEEAPAEFLPLDEQEQLLLQRALRVCNWIIYGERGAARMLGIHPERLRAKMRKYGLKRPGKKSPDQ